MDKILELIENVDVNDSALVSKAAEELEFWLDENARGWQEKIPSVLKDYCVPDGEYTAYLLFFYRDALKAIRPEGWFIEVKCYPPYGFYRYSIGRLGEDLFKFRLNSPVDNSSKKTLFAKTEELAELHTIIQAIQYYSIYSMGEG